jgi:hypothetical protein
MLKNRLPALFLLVSCATLGATDVQVQTKPSATPARSASPGGSPKTAATPSPSAQLPKYRPALPGFGPTALINRIDTAKLIADGQKDAQILFRCSVTKTGEVANTWTYRGSPDSKLLERELVRCLDTALFIPAVHNGQPVHVLFFGTVTFQVVNGKPRLRIFANQETEEVKKESDFVGPQPFIGPGSKFEGLHYPADAVTQVLNGIVDMAMKVDADGNLKEAKVVSEEPPLVGFRRAAAEDFRVASFIPAFREGKPVECSITLPVYYEPVDDTQQ